MEDGYHVSHVVDVKRGIQNLALSAVLLSYREERHPAVRKVGQPFRAERSPVVPSNPGPRVTLITLEKSRQPDGKNTARAGANPIPEEPLGFVIDVLLLHRDAVHSLRVEDIENVLLTRPGVVQYDIRSRVR